jgi:hypothetical protein
MPLPRFLRPHPSSPLSAAAETERNIRLAVVNGILFIFSETLLDPTLVLVAFVSHLTSSPPLLGLILPIHDAFWSLPQLWVSGYLQSQPVKIELYRSMSFIRIVSWGMIAVAINLVRDPTWLLVMFFLSYSVAQLASGLSGLPFLEVVSKTVPPQRRGEMFAQRLGYGGLLGVAGSGIVRWLISPQQPLAFPYNFGLLAFGSFAIASISLLIYNTVHEAPDEHLPPRAGLLYQTRRAIGLLRNEGNYRRLLTTQTLLIVAGSATPFFAVFVQQALGGASSWVGIYLGVLLGTNLLANLYFGRLSRRTNNQKVLFWAAAAGTAMSLVMVVLVLFARALGISSLAASLMLVPVFILSGIRGTGFGVASNTLLLNIAPPAHRTLVIGFTQTVLGVVMLLNGVSGLVVSRFGLGLLVLLTLGAHLAALLLSTRIVDETGDARRAAESEPTPG